MGQFEVSRPKIGGSYSANWLLRIEEPMKNTGVAQFAPPLKNERGYVGLPKPSVIKFDGGGKLPHRQKLKHSFLAPVAHDQE